MHNNSYDRFKELQFDYCDSKEKFPTQGETLLMQLINTKRFRGSSRVKEYLKNYWDFLIWALEVKLINQRLYDDLFLESYSSEKEAQEAFRNVISIRDSMYSIILAYMEERPVLPEEFNAFNRVYAEVNNNLQFVMTERGPRRVWINIQEQLAAPLWAIVRHAAEFIVSDELRQVTICECGNMFVDESRRKTRLWCCKTCANSYWSKTYYERKKEADADFRLGIMKTLQVEIIGTNGEDE